MRALAMKKRLFFIPHIRTARNLKGARVLLRLDLNEPLARGRVLDDFRIRRSIPTIKFLKKKGARVIILAHEDHAKGTLRAVSERLNRFTRVSFEASPVSLLRDIGSFMKNGSAVLLENIRRYAGEEKNSVSFARTLARMGDVYVNDAFSVCHRTHASVVSLPRFLPSYSGLLMHEEIAHLSLALSPKHPFVFILGGAKFSTKMPLIKKYLQVADSVFVGGALSNNFYKVMGMEIGRSHVENPGTALLPLLKNEKLILPSDVRVVGRKGERVVRPGEVSVSDCISDAGDETVRELSQLVARARLVVFNGPLGNYEEGFDKGTNMLLSAIGESRATSIVGGGDTLDLIGQLGIEKKFTFVSTGGGAMIEFLAKGTLPGIEALKKAGSNKRIFQK